MCDIGAREDELGGKTLLVVGRGRIGARLARLAKAFDMTVVATRRKSDRGADGADAVFGQDRLREVLRKADIVALTCPLTRETENLIDAKALALMKPTAHLVDVARGGVIDEAALISALQERHRRRRSRRHARRAACGRFGAVDHAQRFDDAAYRG